MAETISFPEIKLLITGIAGRELTELELVRIDLGIIAIIRKEYQDHIGHIDEYITETGVSPTEGSK